MPRRTLHIALAALALLLALGCDSTSTPTDDDTPPPDTTPPTVDSVIPGDSAVRLGAAIRNVGTRLRIDDQEEADRLPTRIEVGLSYRLGIVRKYLSDVDVHLAGDIVADESADDPSARLGADLVYQNTVHLRAGYLANDTDGANAALGFGLGTGRLLFDIARTFGGLSEGAGKTPAYVSLRFIF